jgi:hypothetical protein
MTVLIVLIASGVSAILYRMGGAKGYDTLYRDIGCAAVACLLAGYLLVWSWTLILCFGLMWGALSMYWKFGRRNSKWYNWLATGAGYSIAMLPLVIQVGCWKGFISRTIVLGALTMIWSELQSNDVKEELGRGFLIPLTLPLLLI